MKNRIDLSWAAECINTMTASNTKIFLQVDKRDVFLEKTGEGPNARYILTWGLEGEGKPAGREGFIAILDTKLAVESVLDHKPPEYKGSKGKLDPLNLYFDDSKGPDQMRRRIVGLIGDIMHAHESERLALYRRVS